MASFTADFKDLIKLVGKMVCFEADDVVFKATIMTVNQTSRTVVMQKVSLITFDGQENAIPGLQTFTTDELVNLKCLESLEPADSESNGSKKASSVQDTQIAKQNHSSNLKVKSLSSSSSVSLQPLQQNSDAFEEKQMKNEQAKLRSALKMSEFTNWFSFGDHSTEENRNGKRRPNMYVILDRVDDEFDLAISYIRDQNQVGCGFDGVYLGREGQLCWIQLTARNYVFCFDMLSLGYIAAFRGGLEEILESPVLLKVMHDCRQASDLLFNQFNISLVNVYDTQVADVMIIRGRRCGRVPKYVRSLAACLAEYLFLSDKQVAFYETRKIEMERDPEIWCRRPLPESLLETIALNVRYLRELRQATLQSMLEDFTYGVDIYLHTVRDGESTFGAHHGECLPEDFWQLDYRHLARINSLSSDDPEDTKVSSSQNHAMPSTVSANGQHWEMPALERLGDVDVAASAEGGKTDSSGMFPFEITFSQPCSRPESSSRQTGQMRNHQLKKDTGQSSSQHRNAQLKVESTQRCIVEDSHHSSLGGTSHLVDRTRTYPELNIIPAGITLVPRKK